MILKKIMVFYAALIFDLVIVTVFGQIGSVSIFVSKLSIHFLYLICHDFCFQNLKFP